MNKPKRKQTRLKDYDYSQAGYYFVTVCTFNHQSILSRVVGGGFHAAPCMELTDIGLEIEQSINYINQNYDNITVDKYVIMPNHIHCIVIIESGDKTGRHGNLPLQKVVGQIKSFTSKRFNEINNTKCKKLWQRNYHDHIIRNKKDYQRIWEYINTNPQKWELDRYYIE